jgi:hypothetical protein
VPGEWYAPTQPIPLDSHGKPFAYDWNGFQKDYIIDFTPELRAEGERIVSRVQDRSRLHAAVVSKVEGPLGTLSLAINWRRHRVGGRVVRSRHAHHVRLLAPQPCFTQPGQAG